MEDITLDRNFYEVNPHRDPRRDLELFKKALSRFNEDEGIRVGDIVNDNGVIKRVAYVWSDRVQLTKSGSFYINPRTGFVDYSGALESGVPIADFKPTGNVDRAWFWTFSGGHHTAHNGVNALMPVRVWTL